MVLLATFLIVEMDFLNRLFGTVSLDVGQWVLCIVAGSLVLWFLEIVKLFQRRAASSKRTAAAATEARAFS